MDHLHSLVTMLGQWWMSTPASEKAWLGVGFLAQLMFSMRFIVQWIASERVTRVPWDAVLRITSDIRLEKEAAYYGLRVVERDLERRMSRIPGARD